MATNWNTAEVRVASKSGLSTRSFCEVEIPDDSEFLRCWREVDGERYCEIPKNEVGKVYINLNAKGKHSRIVVWENQ